MKRFWLVLLSLGLVLAFSASAMAVDVKFSGSYYAAGMYVDKTTLNKDTASDGPSTAFYFQRLRVQTEFIVSPGLSFITRFDAMERAWGATRSLPNTTAVPASMGTKAENENIAFDYAYLNYATPIGTFQVGSRPGGAWGTVFADSSAPAWRLYYKSPSYSGFQWMAIVQKSSDKSYSANNPTAVRADQDYNIYYPAFIYTAKSWSAGVLGAYYNDATGRAGTADTSSAGDYRRKSYLVEPYVKAQIGPVAIQAELDYAWGRYQEYDNAFAGRSDVRLDSLAGWIDAVATFGPVYVGGTFAYSQGQGTDPTVKNNERGGGLDWSPTLIMWNEDRAVWLGALSSSGVASGTAGGFGNAGMYNAWFYQGKVGVKPIEELDIMASLTYATADTIPTGYVSKNYGYEVDVTGTYKITNNLSYMLGVGYLFTGDYFKGTNSSASVANDFLVINKLTLTF